jgi:hypothetical protein
VTDEDEGCTAPVELAQIQARLFSWTVTLRGCPWHVGAIPTLQIRT